MISALNNRSNNPSFTSVVPVRVFIDGLETFNQKNIKTACHQLTSVLVGPAKNNEKNLAIIREFAKHDPDYNINYGFYGYPKKFNKKSIQPSEYFRCIADNNNCFIFTGPQAEKLKELGKALGAEKIACKTRNIKNSFDLQAAKRSYRFMIGNYIKSTKLKIKETFDEKTRQKLGKPVEMIINMTSNGKAGLKTFKMKLADISFNVCST